MNEAGDESRENTLMPLTGGDFPVISGPKKPGRSRRGGRDVSNVFTSRSPSAALTWAEERRMDALRTSSDLLLVLAVVMDRLDSRKRRS